MDSARISDSSSNLLTICIILSVFLHSYRVGIPGVSLGELLLIVACLTILIQTKFSITVTKIDPLVLFFITGLLTTTISLLIQQPSYNHVALYELVSRFVRYFAYILFVILAAKYFNFGFALKYYRIFCIILSVYILFQFAMYYGFHIMLPIKILPLEWQRINELESILSDMDTGYFRAYGVFMEPAYAANFLLPGFAFALFGWIKKHNTDYKALFLISIAIILTTSLQGILVAVATAFIYVIWIILPHKVKPVSLREILGVFIIIFVLAIAFVALNIFGVLDIALVRLGNIYSTLVEGGSGSIALRLFRGWSVFIALPLLFKLIGTGYGNIANFVDEYDITTKYDSYAQTITAMESTDGVSSILIFTGVIGFIIFCKWIIILFNKVNVVSRIILLQFILLLLSGTAFFSLTMVFYMGFVYAGSKRKTTGV